MCFRLIASTDTKVSRTAIEEIKDLSGTNVLKTSVERLTLPTETASPSETSVQLYQTL